MFSFEVTLEYRLSNVVAHLGRHWNYTTIPCFFVTAKIYNLKVDWLGPFLMKYIFLLKHENVKICNFRQSFSQSFQRWSWLNSIPQINYSCNEKWKYSCDFLTLKYRLTKETGTEKTAVLQKRKAVSQMATP